jgi:hypothetical protein
MDLFVETTDTPMATLLARLAARQLASTVMMIDGQLAAPNAPVPEAWRDLRLRTPAGMVTLKRRDRGIAIVVFGNADDKLIAAQKIIAEELR